MSKVISSNALNVAISKGLVRTVDNYFSNEPVQAFKSASKRFKAKSEKQNFVIANKKE
ncbi:hypothetical protein ABEH87_00015 [Erwinia sp. Eh17-17]|uniref:hypothetical protein n=1 Tax=Erwinia sp. Eh17-17 TaxID=3080330 RepID=UPI00320873E2